MANIKISDLTPFTDFDPNDLLIVSDVSDVNTDTSTKVYTIAEVTSGNAGTASKLLAPVDLSISGDATSTNYSFDGSSAVSLSVTLADSGVSANTYNNSATSITPFTVDTKGRVTNTGSAVTITPAWGSITSTPTTISGYGIADAYTKDQKNITQLVTSIGNFTIVDYTEYVVIDTALQDILTITLPTNVNDRQLINISTTNEVTALTLSGSATVNGAPTTLSANQWCSFIYSSSNSTYYRVG